MMAAHAYFPTYDPHFQLYGQLSERGAINTLFVSGLPDDVKPREIHNLFRRHTGFDSCQLKYTGRGNQVVAFVTFFNHQSAIAARHALDGIKFDPQTGPTLHIELARSNSRRKRKPGSGPYVVIDERKNKESDMHDASSDDEITGTDEANANKNVSANDDSITDTKSKKEASGLGSVTEQSEKDGENRPCSTLFIANLGPGCTDDELKQVLSKYPGFNVLKMRPRGGMPVAFADFQKIEQAKEAMKDLQGTMLPSSDRGGMSIEYAKSKMRKI